MKLTSTLLPSRELRSWPILDFRVAGLFRNSDKYLAADEVTQHVPGSVNVNVEYSLNSRTVDRSIFADVIDHLAVNFAAGLTMVGDGRPERDENRASQPVIRVCAVHRSGRRS